MISGYRLEWLFQDQAYRPHCRTDPYGVNPLGGSLRHINDRQLGRLAMAAPGGRAGAYACPHRAGPASPWTTPRPRSVGGIEAARWWSSARPAPGAPAAASAACTPSGARGAASHDATAPDQHTCRRCHFCSLTPSPLARERGLKHLVDHRDRDGLKSLLARGRGSKRDWWAAYGEHAYGSPLARGRGSKHAGRMSLRLTEGSPLARGRGLKRCYRNQRRNLLPSPLARGRGLKQEQINALMVEA